MSEDLFADVEPPEPTAQRRIKITRTFHRLGDTSPDSVVVDVPGDPYITELQRIEPSETGSSFWAWWSQAV